MSEQEKWLQVLVLAAVHYTRDRDERPTAAFKMQTKTDHLEKAALQYARSMGWIPPGGNR